MAPLPLPNALIYLTSIFRPSILRPHLRVPNIAHVDFRALRKEGFNAVVIDKDNCLTIPYEDGVYPPYQTAWNDLLETFRPGRVLVVSNSAGTSKDPGGIAAEAVSLSLRTPVLLHSQNKPGCAPSILSYFQGTLGTPHTQRNEIVAESLSVRKEEKEDELALIKKWKHDVEGPLLGPLKAKDGSRIAHEAHGEGKKENVVPSLNERDELVKSDVHEAEDGPLRIVVVGDRLFTDTLLAHRLSRYLPASQSNSTSPSSITSSVISIHTTSLPQPKDVRILRWIEERLTRGLTKSRDQEQMKHFILPFEEESPMILKGSEAKVGFISSRLGPLRWFTPGRWREVPPLTWNPRSWRPLPLLVGLLRGSAKIGSVSYRGVKGGVRYLWGRGRSWLEDRKARAENAVAVAPPTAREGHVM